MLLIFFFFLRGRGCVDCWSGAVSYFTQKWRKALLSQTALKEACHLHHLPEANHVVFVFMIPRMYAFKLPLNLLRWWSKDFSLQIQEPEPESVWSQFHVPCFVVYILVWDVDKNYYFPASGEVVFFHVFMWGNSGFCFFHGTTDTCTISRNAC